MSKKSFDVLARCLACGVLYEARIGDRGCPRCLEGARRLNAQRRRADKQARKAAAKQTTTRAEAFDSIVPTLRLCRICDMNPRATGVCKQCELDARDVERLLEPWRVEHARWKRLSEAFA